MPVARRADDPAKITSSARRVRSERPASPSVQRNASARLLLPLPLGPTIALIPAPNSTVVRSANDLKPSRRRPVRRAGALIAARGSLRSVVQRNQRLVRGCGLCFAPVSTASVAEDLTAERHLDLVQAIVMWALGADEAVMRRSTSLYVR